MLSCQVWLLLILLINITTHIITTHGGHNDGDLQRISTIPMLGKDSDARRKASDQWEVDSSQVDPDEQSETLSEADPSEYGDGDGSEDDDEDDDDEGEDGDGRGPAKKTKKAHHIEKLSDFAIVDPTDRAPIRHSEIFYGPDAAEKLLSKFSKAVRLTETRDDGCQNCSGEDCEKCSRNIEVWMEESDFRDQCKKHYQTLLFQEVINKKICPHLHLLIKKLFKLDKGRVPDKVGGYPVLVSSVDGPPNEENQMLSQMKQLLDNTVIEQKNSFYYDTSKLWTSPDRDIGNTIRHLLADRIPQNIEHPGDGYQERGVMDGKDKYIFPQVLCLYHAHDGSIYLYPLYAPNKNEPNKNGFDEDEFKKQILACLDPGNTEREYQISKRYEEKVLSPLLNYGSVH